MCRKMNHWPFGHPIGFKLDDLKIEPFAGTRHVQDFDCGESDLNEFLTTDEVIEYAKENLGRTHLVYHQGNILAYFTVCADGLRVEYLKTYKSFSRISELELEALPAIKIGRLAVDKRYQNRGLGRLLVKYIVGLALENRFAAARLLIVQAKPNAVAFYEKCGFQMTVATRRERGRVNRMMFLDLMRIEEKLKASEEKDH